MIQKTPAEIVLIKKACEITRDALILAKSLIREGISTYDIDKSIEKFIIDSGGGTPCKGYEGYPSASCISVNEMIVHGIPSDDTILKDGDIISIDCGVLLDGYNGDSCYTFCVGEVSPEVRQLLKVTKESLYLGIDAAMAGKHIGDIGAAVQDYCQGYGYGIVRELTGHGIGREMHEDPKVPNYGRRGNGIMLKSGMCIAIEPMVTMGDKAIGLMPDRWTVKTLDGKPAAHFEHTIAIRKGKADILSSFEEVERLEGNIY